MLPRLPSTAVAAIPTPRLHPITANLGGCGTVAAEITTTKLLRRTTAFTAATSGALDVPILLTRSKFILYGYKLLDL